MAQEEESMRRGRRETQQQKHVIKRDRHEGRMKDKNTSRESEKQMNERGKNKHKIAT